MLLTLMHNLKLSNLYYLLLIIILALPRWSWAGQEQHLCTDTLDKEYRVIYEINYSYDKYPADRKIAYQYYLDHKAKYYPDLKPEQLGIDLFDIDSDGEKEIFLFLNADWCPRPGCPHAIIKRVLGTSSNSSKYAIIRQNYLVAKTHSMQILEHKSHNYHDILFAFSNGIIVIDEWDGKDYIRKKCIRTRGE